MREIGYAKVNLALHVRRRRDDGYHDLETVFAFCADGDALTAEQAERTSLTIDGPFGDELGRESDNLVLRAARLFPDVPVALRLTKNLPIASGIGGGSADAAAAMRLIAKLSGQTLPPLAHQCALGADVPACLCSRTMRGEGVGEVMTPVAPVTGVPILLVNPRVSLSTAAVFRGWDGRHRGPLDDWRAGRNDLEPAARALAPSIGEVLDWLSGQIGTTHVRMSGSGATCFALFESDAERDAAAACVPSPWWHLASSLR